MPITKEVPNTDFVVAIVLMMLKTKVSWCHFLYENLQWLPLPKDKVTGLPKDKDARVSPAGSPHAKTSFGHAPPLTLPKGTSEPPPPLVLCPEHSTCPFHQGGGGKSSKERPPAFSLLDPQSGTPLSYLHPRHLA